jgi:hypothetical protein
MADSGGLYRQSHRSYGADSCLICRSGSFDDRLRDILRPRVGRHHTAVKASVDLYHAPRSLAPRPCTSLMTSSTGANPFQIGAPR